MSTKHTRIAMLQELGSMHTRRRKPRMTWKQWLEANPELVARAKSQRIDQEAELQELIDAREDEEWIRRGC